jgi:hypothetical protein
MDTMMTHVWMAQCLCPQRHMIAGVTGEADSKADAKARLVDQLEDGLDRLLAKDGGGNPWCGICGAERETWRIEVGRTRFRSMKEAEGPLADNQFRQMLTSAILGTHGPVKPGRA